jgi:hypothetical protein
LTKTLKIEALVALGANVGEMWERIQAVEGLVRW